MVRRILSDEEDNNDAEGEVEGTPSRSPSPQPRRNGHSAKQRITNGHVEEEEEEQDATPSSDHSRKRARLDESGSSVKREGAKKNGVVNGHDPQSSGSRAHNDAGEEDDGEDIKPSPAPTVTLPRDVDGFVPGSIVRVRLENFVTYDAVEFRPGPCLNMILGPNGTGKSSIACAICIGLGWPPSILGRASEISAFVKHGATTAFIEIELKGPAKKSNLTIRRNINSKNRSSNFTINGKDSTMSDVKARVGELNVQVGNLCSFLPQDKVSEFAQMTPQELLKQTQLAAGVGDLTKWHGILIEKGRELKTAKESLLVTQGELQGEREQNERVKDQVEKYKERQDILSNIELWELAGPYMEYMDARDVFTEAKKEADKAKAKLNELIGRNRPLVDLQTHWDKQKTETENKRTALHTTTLKRHKRIKDIGEDIEKLESETTGLQKQMDIVKKNETARQDKMKKARQQIAKYEREIENPVPPPFDKDELKVEMEAWKLAQQAFVAEKNGVGDKYYNVSERSAQQDREIADLRRRLHDLTNETARRIGNLKRWDPECGAVAEWLEKNKDRFQMEVFQPLCVSIDVPEKAYQNAVEAGISGQQMKTFVAQCEGDYQLFNKLVNDQSRETLGRDLRVNVWYRGLGQVSAPPMTPEQMHACGLQCYALDKVRCPDGLRWYLQSSVGLHRMAIGLNEQMVKGDAAIKAISESESGSGNFVSGSVMNRVTRSSYGKRLPLTNTYNIQQARNLAGQSVDQSAAEDQRNQLSKAEAARQVTENEIQAIKESEKDYNARLNKHNKLKKVIGDKDQAIKNAEKARVTTSTKLEEERRRLATLINQPTADDKRKKIKKDLWEAAKKRFKFAIKYKDEIVSLIREQQKSTLASLEAIQAAANATKLDGLIHIQDTRTTKANNDHQNKKAAQVAAKDHCNEARDTMQTRINDAQPELRTRFQDINKEGWTYDSVQQELDECRAQLAGNFATNGDVIDKYERRKESIERLEQIEANRQSQVNKLDKKVTSVRNQWYPALTQLVSSIGEKFSAAFDRIGCAGEIRINEVEDYGNWAIDILVKFRDHENLQLLTAQRQSGGERSLTTILYLMSLTEYARAPFSLVDEINQGMDGRAERAVHDQLVDVTCNTETGQYFLITPKLLPDLTYHKRMRILCVNNGEWLPEEQKIGDLKALIGNYLSKHKQT